MGTAALTHYLDPCLRMIGSAGDMLPVLTSQRLRRNPQIMLITDNNNTCTTQVRATELLFFYLSDKLARRYKNDCHNITASSTTINRNDVKTKKFSY
jgi:hypothetical protein